jgi:hypothetical protein
MLYALELAVLGRIIFDNCLKSKFKLGLPSKVYNGIGLLVIVIGTLFFILSYAGLFMFDLHTNFCLVDKLSQDIVNRTEAEQCVIAEFDLKLNLFLLGGFAAIIILIGNTLQSIPNNGNRK